MGGGVQGALHGAAAPGGIAALVRSGAAVPGVQAVEHHPEEGRPGGLARLVGGFYNVQARLQVQLLLLQLAEGGRETFDLHGLLLFLHILYMYHMLWKIVPRILYHERGKMSW